MIKEVKSVYTQENNKIVLLETQNKKYDKKVLIAGVFHGDEVQGEYLIDRYLKTDISNIKNKLYIIPCLNPDGKSKNQRQNANGVDLNRNFPSKNWELTENKDYYGGNAPCSETETKFMVEILSFCNFDMILSLHSPFKIVNYDGPAKELAKKISQITGYDVRQNIGYPTPGSFGSYAGEEKNIPVITLELPDDETNEQLWITNKPVFDYLAYEY